MARMPGQQNRLAQLEAVHVLFDALVLKPAKKICSWHGHAVVPCNSQAPIQHLARPQSNWQPVHFHRQWAPWLQPPAEFDLDEYSTFA